MLKALRSIQSWQKWVVGLIVCLAVSAPFVFATCSPRVQAQAEPIPCVQGGTCNLAKASFGTADFTNMTVGTATIGTANVTTGNLTTGNIPTLNSTTATVGSAEVGYLHAFTAAVDAGTLGTATIGVATVTTSNVTTETVGTSNVTTLNATTGTLGTANIVNANITTAAIDAGTIGVATLGPTTATSLSVNGVPVTGLAPANALLTTTATLGLFVDPVSGNDSNACTASGASACLTIQGACDRIPFLAQHGVTVTLAAGTYTAGCHLEGNAFEAGPSPTTPGTISFVGPLTANVTPATGTATGTATAGSAGSNATLGTMTDSGQSWTTNNLRGSMLEITAGTGSGQLFQIASNTATAITIAGIWSPAPVSGSTYAIRTATALIAGNVAGTTTPFNSATAESAAFIISTGGGFKDATATVPQVMFRRIRFTTGTNSGIIINDGTFQVKECIFDGLAGHAVQPWGFTEGDVSANYASIAGFRFLRATAASTTRGLRMKGNYVAASQYGISHAGTLGTLIDQYNTYTATVAAIRFGGPVDAQIRFDVLSAPNCLAGAFGNSALGVGNMAWDAMNCTATTGSAFSLAGPYRILMDAGGVGASTVTASASAVAFTMNSGASVRITSSTVITNGGTATDILFNDDTSGNRTITIGQLRTGTARQLTNPYGTLFAEVNAVPATGFWGGGVLVSPLTTANMPPCTTNWNSLQYDSTQGAVVFCDGSAFQTVLYSGATQAAVSLDFPNIAAGDDAELTMTVAGATVDTPVDCSYPAGLERKLQPSCRITSANTVTFRVYNGNLLLSINPAAGNFNARVVR